MSGEQRYRDGYVHGYAHAVQHLLLTMERQADVEGEVKALSVHLLSRLSQWRVRDLDQVVGPPSAALPPKPTEASQ